MKSTIIYRVLYIPGGCLGFLYHQQYQFTVRFIAQVLQLSLRSVRFSASNHPCKQMLLGFSRKLYLMRKAENRPFSPGPRFTHLQILPYFQIQCPCLNSWLGDLTGMHLDTKRIASRCEPQLGGRPPKPIPKPLWWSW